MWGGYDYLEYMGVKTIGYNERSWVNLGEIEIDRIR